MWSNLHRLVDRVAALACRHPKAIVCGHRQWQYDHEKRGYVRGMEAGLRRAEARVARGERVR